MKRIIVLFVIMLQIPVVGAAEREAVSQEKFVVKNISVDEIAGNSEIARKTAMEFAQKEAFGIVLGRFFVGGEDEIVSFDKISNMVKAIEVREEVITGRRYKAIVDVYFHLEQTQFFINNNFLNKEIKKLRGLVVPVFDENGMVKLWQQGNLWYEVWQGFKPSEMIDVKIPLGDIDDMINFKASELELLSQEETKKLEKLYQVDKIIIAEVDYKYQTVSPEIFFEVSLRELGKLSNSTLVAKSEGFKSDDYNKHLEYLLEKVMANLETGWMGYNNTLDDAGRQLFVIKVYDVNEWLRIKKRISDVDIVRSFKVDSFSARYARITLEFNDVSLEALDTLQDLGFKISREQNYIILQSR